jgi:hypothetical protein
MIRITLRATFIFCISAQCIDYQHPYFQVCNFMLGFNYYNM